MKDLFPVIIVVLYLVINPSCISTLTCPPNSKIFPCTCDSDLRQVTCEGQKFTTTTIFLKNIIRTFHDYVETNERYFEHLLFHSNITDFSDINYPTLEEDVFGEISFKKIEIINISNFENINYKAFSTKNAQFVEEFIIEHTNLSKVYLGSISLTNLTYISLANNKLTELPENIFPNSEKLKTVDLKNNQIVIVSDRAFINKPNLEYIDLSRNRISRIPPISSLRNITINLSKNDFLWSGSGGYFTQPTHIILDDNNFIYLDQSYFERFLNPIYKNTLSIKNNKIDCIHCNNKWLLFNNNTKLYQQNIYNMECESMTRSFWESNIEDFSRC
ncbi:unnamed protein product [Didymodactylos carnosus]|uniref:Uncharacterized protein n=1 Tax=Didymodactylos carnosus TaxID=1234261 RepID=A0A815XMR9_9BILA|nr:unnamed protein product [Didymodactylos carnosus]CAF4420794.1 unnamed protein product [Didymodactylos carnosus]